MNEQILELAKQAGYAPLVPRTFADDLQEIFLQKFAQLIVKECAAIASMNQHQYEPTGVYVLKHFGIEKNNDDEEWYWAIK